MTGILCRLQSWWLIIHYFAGSDLNVKERDIFWIKILEFSKCEKENKACMRCLAYNEVWYEIRGQTFIISCRKWTSMAERLRECSGISVQILPPFLDISRHIVAKTCFNKSGICKFHGFSILLLVRFELYVQYQRKYGLLNCDKF